MMFMMMVVNLVSRTFVIFDWNGTESSMSARPRMFLCGEKASSMRDFEENVLFESKAF